MVLGMSQARGTESFLLATVLPVFFQMRNEHRIIDLFSAYSGLDEPISKCSTS